MASATGIKMSEVTIVATYGGIVSGNLHDPKSPIEVFLIFDKLLNASPETAIHVAQEAQSSGFRIHCLEDEPQIIQDLVIPVVGRNKLGAMLLLPETTRVVATLGPVIHSGLSLYACGQAKVSAIALSPGNLKILPVGKA